MHLQNNWPIVICTQSCALLFLFKINFISYCWCLVTKSCPALCDPMNCSTPGFPVLPYLLEFAQIYVNWVGDAIQLSLLSPSPAFNLSQHQGLFKWIGSLHQVAKVSASVLPVSIQSWFPLGLTSLISLQSTGLWRVFSSTTVWKH